MQIKKYMYKKRYNRITTVYVKLWDVMIMRPYCHTELVQNGQKYDLGWKPVPIFNSWGEKGKL